MIGLNRLFGLKVCFKNILVEEVWCVDEVGEVRGFVD